MIACLAVMSGLMSDSFRYFFANVVYCGFCCSKQKKHMPSNSDKEDERKDVEKLDDANLKEEEEDDDEEEKPFVPLTIALLMLYGYLGLGAILFNTFENWGLVRSFYFSFVTVSTIGCEFDMSVDEKLSLLIEFLT